MPIIDMIIAKIIFIAIIPLFLIDKPNVAWYVWNRQVAVASGQDIPPEKGAL